MGPDRTAGIPVTGPVVAAGGSLGTVVLQGWTETAWTNSNPAVRPARRVNISRR